MREEPPSLAPVGSMNKLSYLLLYVHVSSSTTLSIELLLVRIAESFEIRNYNYFSIKCVDDEKITPAKPYRGLPQASHGIKWPLIGHFTVLA